MDTTYFRVGDRGTVVKISDSRISGEMRGMIVVGGDPGRPVRFSQKLNMWVYADTPNHLPAEKVQ